MYIWESGQKTRNILYSTLPPPHPHHCDHDEVIQKAKPNERESMMVTHCITTCIIIQKEKGSQLYYTTSHHNITQLHIIQTR